MADNYFDKESSRVVSEALKTGSITRKKANWLRRVLGYLDKNEKQNVKQLDGLVVSGKVKIIED